MTIVPVILAGGVGERFWPLSRSTRPKQLLPIASHRSMLEETLARVSGFTPQGVKPLIVTGASMAALIRRALPRGIRCEFIAEPAGKNTAPAVAIAAAWVARRHGPDAVMVVLPADHAIAPVTAYVTAVRRAAAVAATRDRLVVFGVTPVRPDTGYGYVELSSRPRGGSAPEAIDVKRFVEKPDAATARRYLKTGRFLWNSGMFVWKASVILDEVRDHMPRLHEQALAASRAGFSRGAIAAFYRSCEKESIDYGVMERSRRVTAVCGRFSWDDVGSWEALPRLRGTPEDGTTVDGARTYAADNRAAIVVNRSSLHVAAIGLDNVAIIAVGDAVLAIARDRLPDLKKHLAGMKAAGFPPSLF